MSVPEHRDQQLPSNSDNPDDKGAQHDAEREVAPRPGDDKPLPQPPRTPSGSTATHPGGLTRADSWSNVMREANAGVGSESGNAMRPGSEQPKGEAHAPGQSTSNTTLQPDGTEVALPLRVAELSLNGRESSNAPRQPSISRTSSTTSTGTRLPDMGTAGIDSPSNETGGITPFLTQSPASQETQSPARAGEKSEDVQSELQHIMAQFTGDSVTEREEKEARAAELERAERARRQSQFPKRTSSLQPGELEQPNTETKVQKAEFSSQSQEGVGQRRPSPGKQGTSRVQLSPAALAPPPPEPDLPFDFHRFLEQLRHRTADPVARFLRSFLNEFGKKQWLVHEQVKLIGDFLAFIEGKMAQCEVWRDVSDVEFDNAREGMEKLVMNRLYAQTFSPLIPAPPSPPRSLSRGRRKEYERMHGPGRRGQHQEDVERDDVLAQKIKIYGWIREEHLDIQALGSNGKRFLSLAQQELLKINSYRAPRDKVICILNCCKVLFGLLKHAKSADTSADSFIPLLIFTVLKANPEHLVSNIQYIFRFRNPDKLSGEAGYYLSSLSGAVHFVETLDRTSLTVDDEEFERNVEAAVSAIAASDKERERKSTEATERERRVDRREVSAGRAGGRSRDTSTLRGDQSNESGYDESPVTGLLRSIQKPLSTLGKIFGDESDSEQEPPYSPSNQQQQQQIQQQRQQQQQQRQQQRQQTQQREQQQQQQQQQQQRRQGRRVSREEAQEAAAKEASLVAAEARRIQRNEHRDVVETLSSMFPNLEKDVIDDVVKMKNGRVGPAVDACLALSAE